MDSQLVTSKKMFVTNDMSFAAYLILNGMKITSAKKLGNTFKFQFEDEAAIQSLQISYINSEISKHDDIVRKLKKIAFGESGFDTVSKLNTKKA